MPNIRQKGRKVRDWAPEDMARAVAEVRAGRLSLRQAAAQFGVTRSSLNERVRGRVAFGCLYDQKPLLSPADENSLVKYCLYCARYGFTLTKPQVVATALALYNQCHPEATKKTLGQTWWINFRERHHEQLTTPIPDIIDQGSGTPDVIDQGRAKCAKREPVEDYFKLLQNIIDELGLREKSQQIYSCDATEFPLGSVKRKTAQGSQNSNKPTPDRKEHITVLACFNAAGEDVPPLIIYKGAYPGSLYQKEGFPNALCEKSQTGDIDGELFHKWFVEHFLKYASKERPLLLVMDGHQSHLGPEVVQAAQREGVIFLGLPPHSSHILQPLDEHFLEPVKADFSGITIEQWLDIHTTLFRKKDFSGILNQSYQRVKDRGAVVTGFKRCGLYPVDPDAIDWSRVTPSRPQHRNPSPPPPQLEISHVQIKEEPEEQSIKQEKRQLPLSTVAVCVKSEDFSQPDVQIHWSPESSLKQEIPETPQIKEEPEEQSVEQGEEQLPPFTETSPKTDNIIITNVVSLSYVSEKHNHSAEPCSCADTKKEFSEEGNLKTTQTNTSPLLQQRPAQKETEDRENKSETEEQTDDSSDTDDDEDWEPPASTSTAQMETEADGDHDNQVQIKDTSTAAHNSTLFTKSEHMTETGAGQKKNNESTVYKEIITKKSFLQIIQMSYTCSICKETFTKKYQHHAHVKNHAKDRIYSCSICAKAFFKKYQCYLHEKTHTDERPYSCSVCKKTFALQRYLEAHMRIHRGVKPYRCAVCNKTFISTTVLRTHEKIHTGERPYGCPHCEKTFTHKKYLNDHVKIHSGEKPYSCSVCKKTFIMRRYLMSHLKSHIGETPYSCSTCNKSFSLKHNLTKHIRTHTGEKPYRCPDCGKAFTQTDHLNAHVKIHTGERPHSCSICKKTFVRKSHLNEHMKTHTIKISYSCPVCNLTFDRKNAHKNHVKIHTDKR